jgi:hypothetical protein
MHRMIPFRRAIDHVESRWTDRGKSVSIDRVVLSGQVLEGLHPVQKNVAVHNWPCSESADACGRVA